jgi:hypothetical protein
MGRKILLGENLFFMALAKRPKEVLASGYKKRFWIKRFGRTAGLASEY